MGGATTGPILVLGAGGQVGGATLAALRCAGLQALGLDRSQLDIADTTRVEETIERVRPSVVINAAAYTAVDRAEVDADAAFAINGRAPGVIARATQRTGAALIHLSTDYVFDGEKGGPYVEEDPVAPLSVYGESKLAGEQAILRVGGRGLVLRTSWLLSPYGGFARAILNRARAGEPLRVVSDQIGRPTMTADLAQTLALILQARQLAEPAKIYHYAGSEDATWFDVALELIEAYAQKSGRKAPPLTAIDSAAWGALACRPRDSRLDSARFASDFDLKGRDWRGAVSGLVEAWSQGTSE